MPYKEFEVFQKKMGMVPQLLELIKDTDPEMLETISNLDKVILRDGKLSEKNKRLIAMCMSAQIAMYQSVSMSMRKPQCTLAPPRKRSWKPCSSPCWSAELPACRQPEGPLRSSAARSTR